VTISAGVATSVDRSCRSATSLLEAADAALYRAKRQGRNRTASVEVTGG
jgi:two-component system, chemotaxis family, response regulator WspR